MPTPQGLGRTYRKYMGALSGQVLLTYQSLRHLQKAHQHDIGLGLLDHIAETLAHPEYIFRVQWNGVVRDIYMARNALIGCHPHYTKVVCDRPAGCGACRIVTAYYSDKLPALPYLYKAVSAE